MKKLQRNSINISLKLGKKIAEEIPDNDIDPLHYVNPVSNSFTFKTISEEDLNRIISSMKTCKSAGIDKISVKLTGPPRGGGGRGANCPGPRGAGGP
jgi:hypothetical protein